MSKRVLIVEDDVESGDLCAEALRVAGFTVETVHDGMEAVFRAKAFQPDVVVVDLGLPRLDGIYVAEIWRRDPSMSEIPLIAVSAHLDAHNIQRATAAGFVEMLAKPFDVDQLRAAVERALAGSPISVSV